MALAAFTAAVQAASPVVIWSGGISQHADQWKWAVWCEDGSVGGAPGTIQPCPPGASGPRTSARKLFLEGEHCEDLAKSAPCPDSWYGFLKVAGDRYVVSLPRCERFIPTRYANVRNEFSIIATTSVAGENEVHLLGATPRGLRQEWLGTYERQPDGVDGCTPAYKRKGPKADKDEKFLWFHKQSTSWFVGRRRALCRGAGLVISVPRPYVVV